jgi:hypothetical protein
LKAGECIPFFLLVKVFLGFTQNCFEKRLGATCRFSKRFCKNSGNVPTNRKNGIKIQKRMVHAYTSSFQKSFETSIASGVKRIKICKFSIILEGEMKNNEYLAEHLLI